MRDPSGAPRAFLTVLLSLVRRPWVWGWALAGLVIAAWVSSRATWISPTNAREPGTALPPYDGLFFSAFLFACAVGAMVCAVTGHFAELLAPPRGHVLPRLRRSAMLAMILSTAVILVGATLGWPHPSVVGPRGPIDLRLHALTLATLIAAQLVWLHYAPIVAIIVMFSWGLLSFQNNEHAMLRMLAGEAPALEAALALVAVTLVIAAWVAIARNRGERTPEVDPILESIIRRFRRAPRPVASVAPSLSGTIPALARAGSFTARARRRLHRHAAGAGTPAAAAGLLGGGFLTLWMVGYRIFSDVPAEPALPRLLAFMAGIIPLLFAAASALENRAALLGHGLLLPMRRAQFVRELGLAVLTNQYVAWACALLPVLAIVPFLMPPDIRPTPRSLAPIVCVAAAYQLFAFGAVAWALRWPNRTGFTFGIAALCAVGTVVMFDFGVARTLDPLWLTAIVVVALAAIGLIATLTAYRRWVDSEPPSFGPSKTAATS